MASGQLSVEYNFGQAMVFHPGDMPCPMQLSLQQQGLYARNLGSFEDFYVSDEVTPVNVEDCAEALLLEAFKESQVVTLEDPLSCTGVWSVQLHTTR